MDSYNIEQILGNIIALNPTGTMTFDGTFGMNGSNDVVRTSEGASHENLKKVQSNEIICGYTENFENQISENNSNFNDISNFNFNNNSKNIISILFLIFLLIKFFI